MLYIIYNNLKYPKVRSNNLYFIIKTTQLNLRIKIKFMPLISGPVWLRGRVVFDRSHRDPPWQQCAGGCTCPWSGRQGKPRVEGAGEGCRHFLAERRCAVAFVAPVGKHCCAINCNYIVVLCVRRDGRNDCDDFVLFLINMIIHLNN